MIAAIRRALEWVQRYERHLSAPVFILGFLNDVFITYGRLALGDAILVLGAYVVIAGLATIGSHYLYVRRGTEGWKLRSLRVILSLLAQFVTGGLLSSFLIFYARDATITVSWPFIALLVVILVSDEFFRKYREALSFRSILFFFTLYTYVIFALPYAAHQLGIGIFLASTVVTIAIFALFLAGLRLAGNERLVGSLKSTIPVVAGIIIALNTAYFTGIIPPLPLALKEVGVYHSVLHTGGTYTLQGEQGATPWWDVFGITSQTIHVVGAGPLYVYSSVFAPTKFSAGEVHQWQHYNESTKHWDTIATISFPIKWRPRWWVPRIFQSELRNAR